MANLCKLTGVKKLTTSLYHHQTNGQCERFNSTLIDMLEMLPPECKSDWKGSIGALVHAYNCTQNSTMGFSPLFSHVWKTTLVPHECYHQTYPKINNHTHHYQVCPEIEGPH